MSRLSAGRMPRWACWGGRAWSRSGAADLASPCRRGLGSDGQTALTAARAGRIRAGDLVLWLKPVAVAGAVVRRYGRVRAAGHPAYYARLGVAGQRLDERCGSAGTID